MTENEKAVRDQFEQVCRDLCIDKPSRDYDLAEVVWDAAVEAALQSQSNTPQDGWKLVPVEPTQAMCQAGQDKAREWPKFPLRISPIYQAMLAAAPKSGDIPDRLWQSLFWDLAKELKCLPSSFVDANEHVFNKARQLMALSGESGISYSSHKPTVFHDREATNEDLVAALIDKLKQHIPYCDESGVIGFALHDYGRILQLAEELSTPLQQQEQKHGSAGSIGEAVQVCAECDIAGCRHIRERSTPSESQAGTTQEVVAEWSRVAGTGEINFRVIGDPYVEDDAKLYLAPPTVDAAVEAFRVKAVAVCADKQRKLANLVDTAIECGDEKYIRVYEAQASTAMALYEAIRALPGSAKVLEAEYEALQRDMESVFFEARRYIANVRINAKMKDKEVAEQKLLDAIQNAERAIVQSVIRKG